MKNFKEPWLSQIIKKNKIYDGRLNRGFWKSLGVGDQFIGFSDENMALLKIVERNLFDNFGAAWETYGKKLIPTQVINDVKFAEDANSVYRNFFTDSEVSEFGVVIFKLEVVKNLK